MERVVITSANIDRICSEMAADQESEVKVGQTISTWAIIYEGNQRGQMTVFHDNNRAAIAFGGPSIWGDWDDKKRILHTDDGVDYDEFGNEVEEEEDDEE